jgi:hypothetical protein
MRVLLFHADRCRVLAADQVGLAAVFVGYGTGHSCDPYFRHVDTGKRFGWSRAGEYVRTLRASLRRRD